MQDLLFAYIMLISIAGNYDKPAKMITHYEYVHSTIRRITCSWTKAYSSDFRLLITINPSWAELNLAKIL
jgi:hypothetical protein